MTCITVQSAPIGSAPPLGCRIAVEGHWEVTMPDRKMQLVNEIRYAERLCARTARLYRRLHSFSLWLTIVGGSATLAALVPTFPHWLSVIGASFVAVMFGANVAIRPHEKAVANDADARKYAMLRSRASTMDADALRLALNQARETDVPEVEPLREVAWNDVAAEIGSDQRIALNRQQRLLAALA